MQEDDLLGYAAKVYGDTLDGAQPYELMLMLSSVALEMECRHISNSTSKTIDRIYDLMKEAEDRDLMTLAVATALCLRAPEGGGIRISLDPLLTPA